MFGKKIKIKVNAEEYKLIRDALLNNGILTVQNSPGSRCSKYSIESFSLITSNFVSIFSLPFLKILATKKDDLIFFD